MQNQIVPVLVLASDSQPGIETTPMGTLRTPMQSQTFWGWETTPRTALVEQRSRRHRLRLAGVELAETLPGGRRYITSGAALAKVSHL